MDLSEIAAHCDPLTKALVVAVMTLTGALATITPYLFLRVQKARDAHIDDIRRLKQVANGG